MTDMPKAAHAKPRDHLWVLVVIAGFAMYDVWEAWTQIGDKSGFAHGTGWTLTIIAEAYWGYSLFALFRAPGKRSRRFAGWSAGAVFAMSAVSQVASHLAADKVPPAAVVGFVSVLPVTVLALIAFLVHLRQKDREDATEVVRQDAKDAEIAALQAELVAEREAPRAELESLVSDLEAERAARESAQRELAEALTRAEMLARKLAAKSAQPGASRARKDKRASAPDEDLTLEFRALDELQKDPDLRKPRMGGELARRLGVSPATGRRLHGRLTAQDRSAGSLSERSAERPDERSGERS